MVSKASEDFPDPEIPVNTINRSRGSSRETSLRLCSRAPRITSTSDTDREYWRALGPAADRGAPRAALAAAGDSFGRPPGPALPDLAELLLEVPDLVPEAGGVLEPELRGGLTHLLLQRPDQPRQLVLGQLGQIAAGGVAPTRPAVTTGPRRLAVGADLGQDVGDGLANGLRIDPVLGVVRLLHRPAPLGLGDRPSHRVGDRVRVHDDLAVDVARRTAHGLDARRLTAEE